jgi:hypothetical protein
MRRAKRAFEGYCTASGALNIVAFAEGIKSRGIPVQGWNPNQRRNRKQGGMDALKAQEGFWIPR